MKADNPYLKLAHYILPEEIESSFELVDVEEEGKELHLYLEERAEVPAGYEPTELQANGFYEASCIQDFPVRDRRVKLYVKRRRWKEKTTGKSVSKDWDLVAQGTRHSKEFAAFLKGMLGEIPDHGPLA
jgi:transposase